MAPQENIDRRPTLIGIQDLGCEGRVVHVMVDSREGYIFERHNSNFPMSKEDAKNYLFELGADDVYEVVARYPRTGL